MMRSVSGCPQRGAFLTLRGARRLRRSQRPFPAAYRCCCWGPSRSMSNHKVNPFGIPLVDSETERKLFGPALEDDNENPLLIEEALKHLAQFGIQPLQRGAGTEIPNNYMTSRDLKLKGGNVESHFYQIGMDYIRPYLSVLEPLMAAGSGPGKVPQMPELWRQDVPGWTRYDGKTAEVAKVTAPLENCFVFDVEVCVGEGQHHHHPVMATALSHEAWYSWTSPHLLNKTAPPHQSRPDGRLLLTPADLIPVDDDHNSPRLIIGHNVSYDRARCAEQYRMTASKTRFMDTMSLHIAVSGMTSDQRSFKQSASKESDAKDAAGSSFPKWVGETSLNNLNDVYNLYCAETARNRPLKKVTRDAFVSGTLDHIRADFQNLMSYCASDVLATHAVFLALFPIFRSRCPHPVTLAGMLEMALAFLPTNSNWDRYLKQSDDVADEVEHEVEQILQQQAKENCHLMMASVLRKKSAFNTDLWMWDEDWTTTNLKLRKSTPKKTPKSPNDSSSGSARDLNSDGEQGPKLDSLSTCTQESGSELQTLHGKFASLMSSKSLLYKNQPKCPGYPVWYANLCERDHPHDFPEPKGLSPAKSVTPKLLRLTWMGYPLHRHDTEKWGYFVPDASSSAYNDGARASKVSPSLWDLDTSGGVDDDDVTEETPRSPSFPAKEYKEYLKIHMKNGSRSLDEDHLSAESDDHRFRALLLDQPKDYQGRISDQKKPRTDSEKGADKLSVKGCPDGFHFVRLPHKDGKDSNVGNPLSKNFLEKVMDGVLSSASGHSAEKVLKAAKSLSYWRSNQDRIKAQMVVQIDEDVSAIIPMIVPAGTITRRAVERTWLTASNAKGDRIGSELKALIQAPSGYAFVGADVDSQELWIASLIGDSNFTGHHGSTALGWMTLQGTKAEGTDMHSVVAKSVQVSRDQAKVLNYGRIYGAGVPFAKQLLMGFNPALTPDQAGRLASKMYAETKGERTYVLNKLGALCFALDGATSSSSAKFENLVGMPVSKREMSRIVKVFRKLDENSQSLDKNSPLMSFKSTESAIMLGLDIGVDLSFGDYYTAEQRFESLKAFVASIGVSRKVSGFDRSFANDVNKVSSRSKWEGGSESHTFNQLEAIALAWHAKTPVLGCRISRVLESEKVGSDYLPSRINWVVQSSAVDYLHLLLVAMRWLMDEVYDIKDGRFAISIHDEVRYIVRQEDRYRAALALQMANLLVRAMFCSRLGMKGLPVDVAFFSSVDVDTVVRKEPGMECVTPSNPQGLSHGYGIPPGESLSIKDILQKLESS